MAREISLNKEVFNKRIYQKTIDTSFKELGIRISPEQLDTQPTVQEFFDMYNELFYQINERNSNTSHEYLVKTSGEYISFEKKDELLQALQLEIANLRKELLQTQQDLADSLGDLAEASQPLPEIEEVEIEIPNPVVDAIDTPEPTQDNPPVTSDPYPNSNDKAIAYKTEYPGYKYVPISYKMMTRNLDYVIQNNLLKNDSENDKKNTLEGVKEISYRFNFDSRTTEEQLLEAPYRFVIWDKIRETIKLRTSGDAKENLYDVVSRTVDKMNEHYKAERNLNEEGGFL